MAAGYDNFNGPQISGHRPDKSLASDQSILPQHEAAVIDLVREAMASKLDERAEQRIRLRLKVLKTAVDSSTDAES